MMRAFYSLFLPLLGLICQGCNLFCSPPPCVPPDVNELLTLEVQFASYTEEQLQTLTAARAAWDLNEIGEPEPIAEWLDDDKTIRMGGDELPIALSYNNINEEVHFGYQFYIEEEPVVSLSDIEVVREIEKCSCARYSIGTMTVNGEVVTVNADFYVVEI